MYEEVLKKVIQYYEEELDDPSLEITPESDLMEDLELSSLEMLKGLVYLEVEFGIEIPERYLRRMITVQDTPDLLTSLKKKVPDLPSGHFPE